MLGGGELSTPRNLTDAHGRPPLNGRNTEQRRRHDVTDDRGDLGR